MIRKQSDMQKENIENGQLSKEIRISLISMRLTIMNKLNRKKEELPSVHYQLK